MFSMLLVDDHKHLVESMAQTIPWDQFEIIHVYTAYSSEQALDIMTAHEVHILVTDIRMPGISGLELIQQARELAPGINCILLTGYAQFEYANQAIKLQAIDYLVKPVRDEELIRSVRGITEKLKLRLQEQAELQRLQETLDRQVPQLRADLLAAKADAELFVLEERERIAEDIHDIVGHTLTTTLVQMEAARLLLARNEQEGMQRLEKSQQLVRKSLSDIREAVSLLKHPEQTLDLQCELLDIAAEAERIADISIHSELELAAPVTDADCRKVVCHALLEGITNGIRHGGSRIFRMRLNEQKGKLIFSLWNNGTPYRETAPGFGLSTMQERVNRLGGTMRLAACEEPPGTLLELHIPL
ncbi:response regulator [Paenibacillus thalictri]|uniref:histidine kinase n=1 Tax=Paenibacillus thalictri TaxID=2527873 RepID=A0A4V2J420_9BACL|nr:response regulator [Paenibacillus thalictri]TBL77323.1 response regulator [Paenibacillus thalictri]